MVKNYFSLIFLLFIFFVSEAQTITPRPDAILKQKRNNKNIYKKELIRRDVSNINISSTSATKEVSNRLDGFYSITESTYWHPTAGNQGSYNGTIRNIKFVANESDFATYLSTDIGPWVDDSNFFYFYVSNIADPDGTYPISIPKEYNGEIQLAWGSDVLVNCVEDPDVLLNVGCETSNYVTLHEDGNDEIIISYGYSRDTGTRQFREEMVKTNETTAIPDRNFEQALIELGIDKDGNINGSVPTIFLSNVTQLNVSSKGISDLTGIEAFKNLTELICGDNNLSSLNTDQCLYLEYLDCQSNKITFLDVSQNSFLETLSCSSNQLTRIELNENPGSDILNISFGWDTDLTSNGDTYSACDYGVDLDIFVSDAAGFDINDPWANTYPFYEAATGDCPEVLTMDKAVWGDGEYVLWHELWSNANSAFWEEQLIPITARFRGPFAIDIVQNESQAVNAKDPGVADSDYNGSVVHGAIAIVTIANGSYIISDYLGNQQKGTIGLLNLYCDDNLLTNLDVSKQTRLENLNCSKNQLVDLDLSANFMLNTLKCEDNLLQSLNVKNDNNSIITNFSSANNPSLQCIQVDNEVDANNGIAPYNNWQKDDNAVYYEDCTIFIETTYVPDDNFEQELINLGYDDVLDDYVVTSNISGINDLSLWSESISDLTGIEGFMSLTSLTIVDNPITKVDLSKNTKLVTLEIMENDLIALDLTQNLDLKRLLCMDNDLTVLDVSSNLQLEYLDCSRNNLVALNLGANSSLVELQCEGNKLTELVVNQIISFERLACGNNLLVELDVNNITFLKSLSCENNLLTQLDLSKNTSLNYLYCIDNNLNSLNVKNGKNNLLREFYSMNNESLSCIQVDDESAANSGTGSYATWQKDAWSTYSDICFALGVDDEILSGGLNIYPNPVSISLTIDSQIPVERLEVYTVLGQKVIEKSSDLGSVSTEALSKGIYFLKIFSEKGCATKRLIKQ